MAKKGQLLGRKAMPGDGRLKRDDQSILRITLPKEIVDMLPEDFTPDRPESEQKAFLDERIAAGVPISEAVQEWKRFRKANKVTRQAILADLVTAVVTHATPQYEQTRNILAGVAAEAPAAPAHKTKTKS